MHFNSVMNILILYQENFLGVFFWGGGFGFCFRGTGTYHRFLHHVADKKKLYPAICLAAENIDI